MNATTEASGRCGKLLSTPSRQSRRWRPAFRRSYVGSLVRGANCTFFHGTQSASPPPSEEPGYGLRERGVGEVRLEAAPRRWARDYLNGSAYASLVEATVLF